MPTGHMTKVPSTSVPSKVELIKPSGPHSVVHAFLLQNAGAETIYFTYNSDNVTLDNGIELYPTSIIGVIGTEGEVFTHLYHRTETSSGTLKWMKLN